MGVSYFALFVSEMLIEEISKHEVDLDGWYFSVYFHFISFFLGFSLGVVVAFSMNGRHGGHHLWDVAQGCVWWV